MIANMRLQPLVQYLNRSLHSCCIPRWVLVRRVIVMYVICAVNLARTASELNRPSSPSNIASDLVKGLMRSMKFNEQFMAVPIKLLTIPTALQI